MLLRPLDYPGVKAWGGWQLVELGSGVLSPDFPSEDWPILHAVYTEFSLPGHLCPLLRLSPPSGAAERLCAASGGVGGPHSAQDQAGETDAQLNLCFK